MTVSLVRRPHFWTVAVLDAAAVLTAALMSFGGNSLDFFSLLFLIIVGEAFFLSPWGFWPRLVCALLISELFLYMDGEVVLLDVLEPLALALIGTLVFLMHTSRDSARAQLREQATHDPLTGLLNRRAMQDRFTAAVDQLRSRDVPFAVFYVDLDDFKAVNDMHGHDAGDELLAAAARRIEQVMRADDTVGRLGGDEFAVLLGSITVPDHVEEVARRLVATLRTPFLIGADFITVSASIGIAVASPVNLLSAEEMLSEADRAMYAVKRRQKGAYAFTTASDGY